MAIPVPEEVRKDGTVVFDTPEVAKIVRIVLKRAYPKVKFYVRMSRYSGGSSIRAYYDGERKGAPKRGDVQKLIGDYVCRDFDGMTDSSVGLNHWMMPDYSIIIRHRDAFTFNKEINNKQPKGATPVLFGASFVFAEDYIPKIYPQLRRDI